MSRYVQYWGESWKLDEGDKLWSDGQSHNDAVVDALESLPHLYRRVLEMRFFGRYMYREIADEMGWNSKQQAHQYVQRALTALQRALEDNDETETP